ncbi:hypothetical protein [Rhodopseudomonas palustris]|uniref:hypothetical protein n=1 Tax=Rhodopseudomonas palustris TaxID=1076 RepID=UPI0012373D3F|nr:hypothetical protein [Rhodopseudomonas palustris]
MTSLVRSCAPARIRASGRPARVNDEHALFGTRANSGAQMLRYQLALVARSSAGSAPTPDSL